ncbi:hypothetical protein AAG570_005143 [Ranatra chinensis]|uniref:Uncharacterized protein n=1 Tax=Ranatra chinensis TaxID=642074 RepID=A0ABD0XZN1_9HEMI
MHPIMMFASNLPLLVMLLGVPSAVYTFSVQFPRCSSQVDVDKCIESIGTQAIRALAGGDLSVGIPPLDPLVLPSFTLDNTNGSLFKVRIKLSQIVVSGIRDTKLTKSLSDKSGKHIEWELETPLLEIDASYSITGSLQDIPVSGQGLAHATKENVKSKIAIDYDKVTRDGVQFLTVVNLNFTYTNSKHSLTLNNAGDEVNNILKAKWEEIEKELIPFDRRGISAFLKAAFNKALELIPYDTLFLP